MNITDEADFPNPHPGDARGDDGGVVHVPHPPLHKSHGNGAQNPAYCPQCKGSQLEVRGFNQGAHHVGAFSAMGPAMQPEVSAGRKHSIEPRQCDQVHPSVKGKRVHGWRRLAVTPP